VDGLFGGFCSSGKEGCTGEVEMKSKGRAPKGTGANRGGTFQIGKRDSCEAGVGDTAGVETGGG